MLKTTIQSDINAAVAKINAALAGGQMNFAVAKALTMTARDVQAEVKRNMPERFTLRRQWIVSGIRMEPATKYNLESMVYSRDKFMDLQEFGGPKDPRGHYIAIPTKLVRRTPTQMIRKADRPKALGDKAEIVDFKGKKYLALKRPRKGRGKQELRLLYLLVPRAQIKGRLKLREDAVRIAKANFEDNLVSSIEYSMRTAR